MTCERPRRSAAGHAPRAFNGPSTPAQSAGRAATDRERELGAGPSAPGVSAREGHSRLTFTHLNCERLAFTVSVALTVWLGMVHSVTPCVNVCVPASAAVNV